MVGWTLSLTNIATSGAYQESYAGVNNAVDGGDVILAKFDKTGHLLWATYFGGDGNDQGYSICSDTSGNVYITGTTASSNGIATSGAYQTSNGGGPDAFLAKFDDSGNLKWATYLGGNDRDAGHSVTTDIYGNVYLAGSTISTSGISTPGSYQSSTTGSNDVAFLAKFDNSGKLSWCTYYGGKNPYDQGDGAFGVCTDLSGNIYITGNAGESGISTSGAYQTSNAGYTDAFLAKFNSSGNLKWATYYGGSFIEYGTGVCTSPSGNDVYITGYTFSTNGIATSGVHQTYLNASADAFLAKFSNSGALEWGTYYGGSQDDEAYGVCADASGSTFISGFSLSNSDIATFGAYQTSNGGNTDAFLARFGSSGQLLYGTYYGGRGLNWGYGSCTNSIGNVYMTGWTNSTSGIATPGAFHTSYSGGNVDAFLAKFSFKVKNDAGIKAIINQGNNFCNDTGAFSLVLANYGTIELDSVTIYLSINSVLQKKYNWTGKLQPDSTILIDFGKFLLKDKKDSIRAWTSFPNGLIDSFPSNDSSLIIVNQITYPYANTGGNQSICKGKKIMLGDSSISNHSYSWTSSPPGFTSTLSDPVITPISTTTYYLTESTTVPGCSAKDSAVITVNPLPTVLTGGNQSLCYGSHKNINLGATSINGNAYSWSSNPSGFSATISNPVADPTQTTTYYLTETISATGCTNSDSVVVKVNPLPIPNLGNSKSICAGNIVLLGNGLLKSDGYEWTSNPKGFTSTLSNPNDIPKVSTTYYVTETSSTTGCAGSDSLFVSVIPLPVPVIVGNYSLCGDPPFGTYYTEVDSGALCLWAVNGGKIISGQNKDSVLVDFDPGIDSISVYEISSAGCRGYASKGISATKSNSVNANWNASSKDSMIHFNADDTMQFKYNWLFGDGTSGNGFSTSHIYNFTKDTILKVSLLVTNSSGCTAEHDSMIFVHGSSFNYNIQVFPNPFINSTNIKIELSKESQIRIMAYDDIGRLIVKLADTWQPIGATTYSFDAEKYHLGSAVYFLKILVDEKVFIRPAVRL